MEEFDGDIRCMREFLITNIACINLANNSRENHRWRRMVQQYLHDSVIHTNVLKFNHTCQLTVLNFSGILHWLHRLLSPLHIRPKLCCVVAVVLNIATTQHNLGLI